jgi:hypothetical protein
MQVETAGIANIFPPGGETKAIQEDGAQFALQFEDGRAVTLQLADPGASVAVRDNNNQWSTLVEMKELLLSAAILLTKFPLYAQSPFKKAFERSFFAS